jgi:hypothetical protein
MWIRSASKDLGAVWYVSYFAIADQIHKIRSNNSTKKRSTSAALSSIIYYLFIRKITYYALYEFAA